MTPTERDALRVQIARDARDVADESVSFEPMAAKQIATRLLVALGAAERERDEARARADKAEEEALKRRMPSLDRTAEVAARADAMIAAYERDEAQAALVDARALCEITQQAERESAAREMDAKAALLALREAAKTHSLWCYQHHGDPYLTQPGRGYTMALDAALATSPAALAGQMQARVKAETLRFAHGMVAMRVSGGTAEIAINFLDVMTKMAAEDAGLSIEEIDARLRALDSEADKGD